MQDTVFERGMERTDQRARDRAAAVEWARGILADERAVVLDTETTGVDTRTAALVQIGIVALDGSVLLDALVNPLAEIPPPAYAVHRIGADNVRLACSFSQLYPVLQALLGGRTAVIYNADYDRRVLVGNLQRFGLPPLTPRAWECAMLRYAAYVGEWNSYRGDYKWPKLPALSGLKAHGAVADCLSALEIIKRMAEG
jgi:DNA polymerase-3 subunit epsilon